MISTEQTDQSNQVSQREEGRRVLKPSPIRCHGHLPQPPHLTISKTTWVWAERRGQAFIPQEASHPRKNDFSVVRRKSYSSVGIKAFTSRPSTKQANKWKEFHRREANMVIHSLVTHKTKDNLRKETEEWKFIIPESLTILDLKSYTPRKYIVIVICNCIIDYIREVRVKRLNLSS